MAGCKHETTTEHRKIQTAVTVLPLADIVKQIGGSRVETEVMIPPGVSPADFEPEIDKLKALEHADIYFKVGAGFSTEENFLDRVMNEGNSASIIDCSENIQLIDKDHHIWLGVQEVRTIAGTIVDALIAESPSDSAYFKSNCRTFISSIDSIDEINRELIEKSGVTKFLVYHPAYTYLAAHYNLRQLHVEHEHKSPKGKELSEMLTLAKAENVTRVFIQPQFDRQAIEVIADELDAEIVILDPLPEDYLKFLSGFGMNISGLEKE
jgi:zinc transport system substrate-binding protein